MKTITNEDLMYIQMLIKELEKKMKWGSKNEWTHYHFNTVSEHISVQSGITVSVSSIRRILGRDKYYKKIYNPQMGTRNAICQFLGYENWADFKNRQRIKKNSLSFKLSGTAERILILSILYIIVFMPLLHVHEYNISPVFYIIIGVSFGVLINSSLNLKKLMAFSKQFSHQLWKVFF